MNVASIKGKGFFLMHQDHSMHGSGAIRILVYLMKKLMMLPACTLYVLKGYFHFIIGEKIDSHWT